MNFYYFLEHFSIMNYFVIEMLVSFAQVALRPDGGRDEGHGLHAREQERWRGPRGREEQAGHHQRLHVQRCLPRGV